MSIFGRATFSSAGYAAFRPSYPPVLFNRVLAFHHQGRSQGQAASGSPSGNLLDLGCGHGVVARALAPHFSSVVGVDPSAGMVEQARRLTSSDGYGDGGGGDGGSRITFRQGGAEDLSFLADGSVDCAVAGQAAHWFDYARAWPELARVVRSGGTLAFWGYKDHVIVGHPATTPIYERFTYGEAEPVPGWESMARFWEMPGRKILRGSYRAIVPPAADWDRVTRIAWDPDRTRADAVAGAPEEALWLRKTLTLGQLQGYLRTFSAFHGWQGAHPDKKSRAEGGEGDIIDLMFDEMIAAVPEWQARGDDWKQIEVDVVWGTVLLMAKRR
ncbi:methyltransferase-like protein [Thermothelomyces thermophilus ATCC 42464]|uniref:Methyltransferase-like protein n=1 Tax=Thermothelomyces thermophilus (strain ATCC 42464 / BCRC 31852 / DSM 1799) TaxID=573729 RepID=G2QG73_THET4|nr:methyltransferase-like protein [Thermothelomyces thermophilus ATCC 42464]AEO59333.1 methyltransferase-like protein [Thermothelomyces thermophilus ATCC 42464]